MSALVGSFLNEHRQNRELLSNCDVRRRWHDCPPAGPTCFHDLSATDADRVTSEWIDEHNVPIVRFERSRPRDAVAQMLPPCADGAMECLPKRTSVRLSTRGPAALRGTGGRSRRSARTPA